MAAVLGARLEVESEEEFERAMAMPEAVEGEWDPGRGFGHVHFGTVAMAQKVFSQF